MRKLIYLALALWAVAASAQVVEHKTPAIGLNSPVHKLKLALQNTKPIVAYAPVVTSLASSITNSNTSLTVSSPVGFPSQDTFIIGVGTPVTFTASVAGAASGTLSAAYTVGNFFAEFPNGERRQAVVASGGTAVTWSGALSAESSVTTAVFYEYMQVTAGMGTSTWTVTRGYMLSTATAGASGATVKWYPVAYQQDTSLNDYPSSGNTNMSLAGTSFVQYPPANSGTVSAAMASRVDNTAPIYFTSAKLRANYGAVLTAAISSSTTVPFNITVDQTGNFPQVGTFTICVGNRTGTGEDMTATVASGTTLTISARAQNGSTASSFSASAVNAVVQVRQVDYSNNQTTTAFITTVGGNNAGNHFAFDSPAMGPLMEQQTGSPDTWHFLFDGQQLMFYANGAVSFLVIADGVVMHDANYINRPGLAGNFIHMLDFGSRKPRRITIVTNCTPGAVWVDARDSLQPWDRSSDPVISFDGDSYLEVEGYTFNSVAAGGGLGLGLETALSLGFTNIDWYQSVGGSGYIEQNSTLTRPTMSASSVRWPSLTLSRVPSALFVDQGHNDGSAATPAGVVNSSTCTVGNTSSTTLTVSSISGYPTTTLPFVALCDTELMNVTAVSGTTWTVTRGYGNSTAAVHSAGALSAASPALFTGITTYYQGLRTAFPNTVFVAAQFWQTGSAAGATWYVRNVVTSAMLYGLQQAGGYWVLIDNQLGTWQNSSGVSGFINAYGTPTITGTGYGGAPGYAGGHSANNGNADFYVRDDDIHPSNLGARYHGNVEAAAARLGIMTLQ